VAEVVAVDVLVAAAVDKKNKRKFIK